MPKLTVACVQQRLNLHDNLEACRDDLARYLRTAQAKGARLAVFPELSSLLAVSPMLPGRQAGLLRQAEKARQPRASLWTRAKGKVAESAARLLKVSFRQAFNRMLAEDAEALWGASRDLFSQAARQYGMTIVAGSGYVVGETGAIVNEATVFGADGSMVGRQSKVDLGVDDRDLATPGPGWSVIDSQAGRMGILLGNDMLYPEAGRILAYQGAQILIGLGAVVGGAAFHQLRTGLAARAQENEVFGAVSFLVGANPLAGSESSDWAGQSAIFAPADLTADHSGVLVQVGTSSSEGVITAEWDFEALHHLWSRGDRPVRRRMPMSAFAPLAAWYGQGQTLDEAWKRLPAQGAPAPELPLRQRVAELPAVNGAPVPAAEPEQARGQPAPPDGPTLAEGSAAVAGAPCETGFVALGAAEAPRSAAPYDPLQGETNGPKIPSEATGKVTGPR